DSETQADKNEQQPYDAENAMTLKLVAEIAAGADELLGKHGNDGDERRHMLADRPDALRKIAGHRFLCRGRLGRLRRLLRLDPVLDLGVSEQVEELANFRRLILGRSRARWRRSSRRSGEAEDEKKENAACEPTKPSRARRYLRAPSESSSQTLHPLRFPDR